MSIEASHPSVRHVRMRFGGMLMALMLSCGAAAQSEPPAPVPDPLLAPWPNRSPVGAKAREFTVRNAAGGAPLKLVSGKVNMIAFWATWSSPDVYMLEKLEPISKKLGPRGLVVLALCMDDDEKGVLEAVRSRGVTYDVGWDVRHEAASRYHPDTDPSLYIVDRNGVIRFVHRGYHDGEDVQIARDIESLL